MDRKLSDYSKREKNFVIFLEKLGDFSSHRNFVMFSERERERDWDFLTSGTNKVLSSASFLLNPCSSRK